MKRLLIAITIFGLTACNRSEPKRDTKTMDFGSFTIETPKSWTPIKEKGFDSYIGKIAMDNKDTLSFDLGWYSNKLYEYDQAILDSSLMGSIDTSFVDTSSVIFVQDRMRVDLDRYRHNNVLWDTIDGREAKIVYPRRSGIGTTGVYIDSLWASGSDVDRFNLYGENLKPENEKKVLKALRTLKFRKK
ncbi:hypothetical protein V9K67_26610 [Paraflavisolibacter sp. H34]|uniref:hypothetical protein n=1 Tax=Huijunlia imazamoxiresistens TaxID=3127457 RepID=UPI0030169D86